MMGSLFKMTAYDFIITETVNKRLANFISVVLHPLLMPTFLFLVLFFCSPSPINVNHFNTQFRFAIIGFIFIYTFAFPAGLILWLYKSKMVATLTLDDLNDRRLPYWTTAIIYLTLGIYLAKQNSLFYPTSIILWSISTAIVLVAMISNWWKISAHTAGIGGVIGAIAGIYAKYNEHELWIPFLISIILGGFVASARLALNAHSPKQVYAGFGIGLLISVLGVTFFL